MVTEVKLPSSASVVIIGGGIQGLACAFNLARLGIRHIIILDAGYWQSGASGRNGTMIRGGFGTMEWTALFHYSAQQWGQLSRQLGHNVMFSRRGYSMVAETSKTKEMLERAHVIHKELGVRSRFLSRKDFESMAPVIDQDLVAASLHLEDGGVAPHHAAMHGLIDACRANGVEVHYRTAVTGIEAESGGVRAVRVGDQRIAADAILIAAGGHSVEIAAMAGITLPGHSMRIEAMALEPVRPVLRPALALIDSLCYLHQTARGEIVGGTEVPETPRMDLKTDFPVLASTAAIYARMMPRTRSLRVLRHWAGLIHATPDYAPLLGEVSGRPGLWISAGWSYGWAGGPGAGALMAQAIATGTIDWRMAPFAIDRFERGKPLHDPSIVL